MTKIMHSRLSHILLALFVISGLFAGVAFPATVHSAGNTYYVSSAGNDNNSGTSTASPWKTIAKVNTVNLEPGDSVLFNGGNTFAGELELTSEDAGTSGSPVTIGSYGTGRAKINAGTANGVHWRDCSYIVVKDLEVYGSGSSNRGSGILIENNLNNSDKRTYVRIDNIKTYGFSFDTANRGKNGNGIHIIGDTSDGTKNGFTDVQITNCEAYNNAFNGIYVSGEWHDNPTVYSNSNIVIRGCTTYDNDGVANFTENWSGCGIFVEDTDGAVIEFNLAYSNGDNCVSSAGGPVGIWTAISKNIVIQFNESYNNNSQMYDGGGFDFDGGVMDSILQYNYSHGNRGPFCLIYIWEGSPFYNQNLTVRYNISENDATNGSMYGSISIKNDLDTLQNVYIYNNTIYQGTDTTRRCITADGVNTTSNINLWNNIFHTAGAKLIDVQNDNGGIIKFRGNNYYSSGSFKITDDGTNYTSLNAWRTATGQEKNGSQNTGYSVNPLLTSPGNGGTIGNAYNLGNLTAYKLTSSSPMINAGLDIYTLFGVDPGAVDFYSNPIPYGSAYDIGAHEVQSVSGPTPTPTPTPVPSNLLQNPGFEDSFTGWGDWGNSTIATAANNIKSGTKACRLGTGDAGRYQNVTSGFSAGNTATLSGWGKLNSAGAWGYIGLYFLDSSGATIGESYVEYSTQTSYTQKSLSATVPSGTATIQVYVWKNSGSNYFFVDDLSLTVQ